MRHADKLVARILFLDGSPNMQSLDQLQDRQKRQGNHRMRSGGGDGRPRALSRSRRTIASQVNDRVSRNLFEELTADEEKHIDFLEAQLTLIEQLGVQLYAQKHVGELEGTNELTLEKTCGLLDSCDRRRSREDSISRGKP